MGKELGGERDGGGKGGAIRINLYLNADNGARLLALNCSTFLSWRRKGRGGGEVIVAIELFSGAWPNLRGLVVILFGG